MDNENRTYQFCIVILSILLLLSLVNSAKITSKALETIASISCNNVETTKVVVIFRDDPDVEQEQEQIEELIKETDEILEETKEEIGTQSQIISGVLTKRGGVNYFDGHKETYYNLSMKKVVANAQNRGIEGNYWEREDGAKMLGDYIMVAADQSVHPYGSIVATSLGLGIVVDTGKFALTNHQQIDIATNW